MSRWDEEVERELPRGAGDGRFVRVRCPACPARTGKDDLKNSLSVNVETGWWLCFKCDARGRIEGREGPEYDQRDEEERLAEDSVELLAGRREPLPDVHPLAGDLSLSLSPHREYLAGRGIPEAVWDEAGLCAAVAGRYAGRVIVPVVPRDLTSGFVARSVYPGPHPKYLCPRGMSRAQLYNAAALAGRGLLLAVEGSFDALAHWPDAVAFLGKPTEAQVELLSRTRRPVAVVLDPDAWREGEALCSRLRVRGLEAGCVVPPPGLDAALLPRDLLAAYGEHSLETDGPVRLRA